MRLLANENFPAQAIDALRSSGHDVVWVRTDGPGASDSEVLARANVESRVLLTFDKDFGELAFREGMTTQSGIILFRIAPTSPTQVASVTVAALTDRTDWSGHFSVVEENRIRMTRLPS